MTKTNAWETVCHPIRPRSEYKSARSSRRQAMARRVLGWLAVLVVVGGTLAAFALKG